jgi:NAD(P)-dependent dehydrogenase (short-subunit alcohol dehydrogenase family)
MDLKERVAVISGATGGLGRVVARALAERGAALALLSSDPGKLDALAGELGLPAAQCLTVAADLRDPQAVQSAARAVVDRFGRAHILLHLVGGWAGGKELTATDSGDLRAMLDQHVWTTWHLLQAFIPSLVASRGGRVVVVSSTVAARPPAKMGAYAAAKAAEEALILTLAQEARDKGVTANILQVRAIDVDHKREDAPSPSNAAWTTPEEITAAILYLCTAEAGAVNGMRLSLTGGRA